MVGNKTSEKQDLKKLKGGAKIVSLPVCRHAPNMKIDKKYVNKKESNLPGYCQ